MKKLTELLKEHLRPLEWYKEKGEEARKAAINHRPDELRSISDEMNYIRQREDTLYGQEARKAYQDGYNNFGKSLK